jgi:23S rRNA (adenine2503-C2)-methyltransferase
MKITNRYHVPTGDILVVEGDKGPLECLSLGDYGKDVNVKCDAMGLSREPSPVRHTAMLPLMEKWVITISAQYGCSMGCNFCDVPKVGPGVNATFGDLVGQVMTCVDLHPEVEMTRRLNLRYTRMGEPTWNPHVLESAYWLKGYFMARGWGFHPVVSTMLPLENRNLEGFLCEWMEFKNGVCQGNAGLQLSINSTDRYERDKMFGGKSCSLSYIADFMRWIPPPVGRKITLNFAVAGYSVNEKVLVSLFPPKYYLCKLTPMHKTTAAIASHTETAGDYTTYHPYQDLEQRLKSVGYDVLVFIASREEDEGRITCGNAVLSGTRPFDIGA